MKVHPPLAAVSVSLISLALAAATFAPAAVLAARLPGGSLDPTFGSGGKILTDVGGGDSAATAVALEPNGMIVTAGFSAPTFDAIWPATDFAVARYTRSGDLDPGFGVGGTVVTDVSGSGSADYAFGLALQHNGRIVVAGYSGPAQSYDHSFAIVRYLRDGSLDPSFGVDGKVRTDFNGTVSEARALAIQPDGRIVAAGYAAGDGGDFALARYLRDGSLDPSFGVDGKVLTTFGPGSYDFAWDVALQQDGKIVVAGYSDAISPAAIALARYNSDGSLDGTFGTGGTVVTPGGGATAIAIQPNGRIVVTAGFDTGTANGDFALVGYTGDGRLDPTFGSGGWVLTDVSGSGSSDWLMSLDLDGRKIVAVGKSDASGADTFAVARYDENGSLDPSFGTGGVALTDFRSGRDFASGVVAYPNGRIVAAGGSVDAQQQFPGQYDFAVARYTR